MKTTMTILAIILFISCSTYQIIDSDWYAGQIERIDYVRCKGGKSMFIYTPGYGAMNLGYCEKVSLGDSVFIHETPPQSFAKSYQWAIINGTLYPIR